MAYKATGFLSKNITESLKNISCANENDVMNRKAGGYQWLINRNKLDAYNIVGIPRILLIDKNFKMVDMNAPAPSSNKITGIIEELLK